MFRRIHALKRAHVDPDVVRVGPLVVVHVNAADFAKVMPRRLRAPLIQRQRVRALHNANIALPGDDGRCCTTAAERAGAASGGLQPVEQRHFKHDGAAMTGRFHRRTFGMREDA